MKSLEQIKEELHECIDGISDAFEVFEKRYKKRQNQWGVDLLLNYQQKELDEMINHGSSDENKSDKELNKYDYPQLIPSRFKSSY